MSILVNLTLAQLREVVEAIDRAGPPIEGTWLKRRERALLRARRALLECWRRAEANTRSTIRSEPYINRDLIPCAPWSLTRVRGEWIIVWEPY